MVPQVSHGLDVMTRLVANHRQGWIKLGNIESALLSPALQHQKIDAPIYICGLARSGSTLLLELLANSRGVASHRYRDFPFLFTPYWWDKTVSLNPMRDKHERERAHGDGVIVSPESPEAMEECLWMSFFPHLHDDAQQPVREANPAFDAFYRQHIQKLLLARKARRYLCKNNYNLTRIAYLSRLFPDARFIIPIRQPADHIASLMRQHKRFSEAGQRDPRVVRHMDLVGHFEFGLHRVPVAVENDARLQAVNEAWQRRDEVGGWAIYWDMLYAHAHRLLGPNVMTVRFEELCSAPRDVLKQLLAHCQLTSDPGWLAAALALIRAPKGMNAFSSDERKRIDGITGATARLYGYGD